MINLIPISEAVESNLQDGDGVTSICRLTSDCLQLVIGYSKDNSEITHSFDIKKQLQRNNVDEVALVKMQADMIYADMVE